MRSGPIAYFAGNPIAANLLMAFFIVGGLIAGRNLPVQSYPDLDLRSVSVTVVSPGSSPREVEEDIVRRVEENVVGLPGVERVVATAYEGRGEIRVELATFANADAVLDDVQSAVDRIENFPPLTAEQPEVQYDRLDIEVMTLAVSSASATEDELRLAAEDLRVHLLELPSVSQVALLGTRDREITIELSEEEMRRHSLTILQISNAVERASLNLTFGELRTDSGGLVLHTVAKRQTGEEFEDIPLIARMDGTMLTLGDVADIRDGFVDEDIIARVDGDPAVFVRVDAAEQQSIVAMGEEIRNSLAGYSAPAGIAVEMWNDRAGDAVERISLIVQNAVIGIILVFICLIVFFDLRVAVWITVGIPLSFLGSLIFFAPTGMTLNLGTIFAFFLMVGIVVDDAVVVGESIAAERERGKGALEAAVSGGASHGRADYHRRRDDDSRLPAVPVRHPDQGSDGQCLSVRGVLRAGRFARGSLLHPAVAPVPRKELERPAAERLSGPGAETAGRDAGQYCRPGGVLVGATRLVRADLRRRDCGLCPGADAQRSRTGRLLR